MPVVTFTGRVIPEALRLTINDHPSFKWQEGDFVGLFRIEIKNSEITVQCEVEHFDKEKHLTLIFSRALDVVRASVNLTAFSKGFGAISVLDTVVDPSGNATPLVLRDRPLGELCTAYTADGPDFQRMLEIVIPEPGLGIALRDLIWAISTTHEIPNSCGRALETLRSLMVPDGAARKVGWTELRQKLNVSEEYLKLITDNAKAPRHGDHQYVSGEITRMIANRSWTLMNRFLEYRKRGDHPLPLSDFSLLAG